MAGPSGLADFPRCRPTRHGSGTRCGILAGIVALFAQALVAPLHDAAGDPHTVDAGCSHASSGASPAPAAAERAGEGLEHDDSTCAVCHAASQVRGGAPAPRAETWFEPPLERPGRPTAVPRTSRAADLSHGAPRAPPVHS